jgi:hypothetical protein
MQDTDHVDAEVRLDIEDQMASDCIPKISISDLVARTATFRFLCHPFDSCPKLTNVSFSLSHIPALSGVIPY